MHTGNCIKKQANKTIFAEIEKCTVLHLILDVQTYTVADRDIRGLDGRGRRRVEEEEGAG